MNAPDNDPERPITVDGTNQWTWFVLLVGIQFLILGNNTLHNGFLIVVLVKLFVFILVFLFVQQIDRFPVKLSNDEIVFTIHKQETLIDLNLVLSCNTNFSTLIFETTEGEKQLNLHRRKALNRDDSSIFLLRLRDVLGSRLDLESYIRLLAQGSDKRIELFQEDFKKRVGDVELTVALKERFGERFNYTGTVFHRWLVVVGCTLVLQCVPSVKFQPMGIGIGVGLAIVGFMLMLPTVHSLAMVVGSEGIGITVGGNYINAYTYRDLKSIRAVKRLNTPDSKEFWLEMKPRFGKAVDRLVRFQELADATVLKTVAKRIEMAAEVEMNSSRGSA